MSANGSNARLDRIERLIEESERANKAAHARREQAHARHEREMAHIRAEGRKTREDSSRRFRDHLRRWAAFSVQDDRDHRKRQREIDLNLTRLSAAQLVTEEKLANLIASRASGGNGGGRRSRT
jgi:hypothetical protein